MLRALPPLLFIALDIFCLIDVIVKRDDQVKRLPKVVWFLLILLLPLIGSILWLALGREWGGSAGPRSRPPATAFPEYERPGRAAGVTPESDEEFLRRVRERAEEQRRKAAEERKRREAEE